MNGQSFFSSDSDDPSTPLLGESLKFVVTTRGGVLVREEPGLKAKRTCVALRHGEIFEVDDIVTLGTTLGGGKKITQHWENQPTEEICFLRLKNGDGWVIDKNIVTEEKMVEPHDPRMSGVDRCRFVLRQFFESKLYEYLITAMIVINAIFIGVEIDNAGAMSYHYWLLINTSFAVIYLAEMIAKLAAYRFAEFFRCPWNTFDIVVITITTAGDAYMLYMVMTHGNGKGAWGFAVIPVLRLLRLLRIAKLFHELRVLLNSFVSSISALTWIALFAFLWFYICACVCTVFLGREDMLDDGHVENGAALRKKFATIPKSMYTLFEVMTLEALTDVVSPLVHHRPFLLFFFLFFVVVTAFFLLNLVTAVVVKRTMVSQKEMTNASDHVEEDLREAQLANMYSAFLVLNDENDIITVRNFQAFQDDEKVQCAMAELNWDRKFLNSLIVMVDHNKAQDEFSLKEMRDLWITYLQPVPEHMDTLLHCQMHIARRLDMQEKLCLKLLEDKEEQQKVFTKILEKLEAGGSLGVSKA